MLTLAWSLALLSQIAAQSEDALQLPLQPGHTNAILEVRWSPNDKLLLTYSAADGFLNIWQIPQGRLIATIEDSTAKVRGSDKLALRAFAWSDDSSLIVTGSENGTAQVWEAETGKLVWSTRIADEYVTTVGFSHDAKYVAAVAAPEDEEHKFVLLDATNGQIIKELGTVEARFLAYYHDSKVVFSDDNKQLLVGGISGIVTRWDLETGSLLSKKVLNLCSPRGRMLKSFAYSDDLALLAARCGLKTEVIDTNTGSILRESDASVDYDSSVVLSRDTQLMAVGDSSSIKLLNLKNGDEIKIDAELPNTCGCDFSKDNTLLAFDDYDDTVKLFDLATKTTVARLEAHPGKIKALAFSPDGRFLASGSEDRIVRLWDAQTGSLVQAWTGHTKSVDVVAFTPDGKLFISASDDQTLKVWDVATKQLLRSIQVTTEGIDGLSSVAFSPDGKQMVGTLGTTVGLWEVSDWRLIGEFTTNEPHTMGEFTYCCGSKAHSARFDARGRLIISGHEDGTIKVWNQHLPAGSQLIRVLKTNKSGESFALSPDERVLIANSGGENPPRLLNWSTGKPLRRLGDQASYVHSVVFSPDGSLVATSDIGGEILLWNLTTGKLVREFDGGYSSDDALAFSPDGTRLVSGGDNQNIIMWDVKSGARLWHIVPIRERHRPTAEEIADEKNEAALKATKERQAELDTQVLKKNVFVTFSHFGDFADLAAKRLVETGQPDTSLVRRNEADASAIWLRLHNNSRLPINFSTESIYLTGKKECGYRTSMGKFSYGLCEGAEIGIRFSVFDAKGKPVRYGYDFGGISMLPPNTSVLFSVPRELLSDGRSIVIRYKFLNENAKGKRLEAYGKEREIKLSKANITRPTQRIKNTKLKSTRNPK